MSAGFAPLRLLLPLLPLLLRCCGSALLPSKQHLHQQQQQHCAPYSSTLLATVETPRGALIPSGIVPLLSTPVRQYLTDDLCLILLGDSTLTETAQDLQLFLELNQLGPQDTSPAANFNFSDWVYKMSNTKANIGKNSDVTYRYPQSHITFHTANRLFYLHSRPNSPSFTASSSNHSSSRTVQSPFSLYFRFIGAPNLQKNNVGLRTLLDPKVRKAILFGIAKQCGLRRRRVLWLQSAFHDAAAASIATTHNNTNNASGGNADDAPTPALMSYAATASALTWLQREVLREQTDDKALFLARQLGAVRKQGGVVAEKAVVSLYAHIKRYISEQQERPTGLWRFVECEEAFSCHQREHSSSSRSIGTGTHKNPEDDIGGDLSTYGLSGHIGAIARGFLNTSYPNYYLSILQTALALRETFL